MMDWRKKKDLKEIGNLGVEFAKESEERGEKKEIFQSSMFFFTSN